MKKNYFYRYMGTNGVIETPVYLEGIYCLKLVHLIADPGYALTDGEKVVYAARIPESEVSLWIEIEDPNPIKEQDKLK